MERTSSLILDENVRRKKGDENCYYDSNPEHICEEIVDNKEKLDSNAHMSRSSSVSSINNDTWY
ncbi:hypothetical protein IHO40_03225 [Wolbachia endosymbiont of Mansonella ozzardi]|uniref:hypothetical protein n=1 Tax=Wolbachia endosymbiont of Mansonella ozzardi TaxID=137464 RepID=UPI001CE0D317|nr:hypothetical protein [Wolbachia endosymbiont of Mansonella ozzardi]MCA4775111.1 hypothetical protein [Wolbachia endosymbiont of Mansonella ozzardi]